MFLQASTAELGSAAGRNWSWAAAISVLGRASWAAANSVKIDSTGATVIQRLMRDRSPSATSAPKLPGDDHRSIVGDNVDRRPHIQLLRYPATVVASRTSRAAEVEAEHVPAGADERSGGRSTTTSRREPP